MEFIVKDEGKSQHEIVHLADALKLLLCQFQSK